MKKRVPETRGDNKEERHTSSVATYSAEEVERIRKAYDAKLAALESKIHVIEKMVLPKSQEPAIFHTPMPHSKLSSLERSSPEQLLELFEASLKPGSKKPDFRILTSAWGILFSSLFLSSTELQNEFHKIGRKNLAVLREVVKTDCARGGKFVFDVIKKGGQIDRSALILIADIGDLAGIEQDGVPAIHLLTRACDKSIRPVLIEKAGKQLLSSVFDSNGSPVLFSIMSMGDLSIYDLDAIENVFSKDDLRKVMTQNKMGRNGLEAFSEISTRIRENLALRRKTFTTARPGVTATDEGSAGPLENPPVLEGNTTDIPADKGTGSPAEPGDSGKSTILQHDASPMTGSGDTGNKNIKILIVDDSELIRLLLNQRLNDLGYENCVMAKSGDEAVKIAEETRPFLIFMDINMPGKLDGIAAAREIKARLDTRIIFLTSCCNNDTLDLAKGVNPDGYILKPFSETNIRVALKLLF